MTQYPEAEPEDGYYELTLGFMWSDNRNETPNTVTVDFQVTSEMEDDYPGEEEERKHGFMSAEKMRARWLVENLRELLDRGFVTKAYGHEDIQNVSDLEDEFENIKFDQYY
jgi:hypothetical protein